MDIREEYEELYQKWLQEFNKPDLTPLPGNLLEKYKNLLSRVDNYKIQEESELGREIINEYKEKFHFLFDDLLKIRKKKIMNAALSLQEIDLDLLFESEKTLYQKLIASLKEYQREKSLTVSQQKVIEKSEDEQESQTEINKELEIEATFEEESQPEMEPESQATTSMEPQPETSESVDEDEVAISSETEEAFEIKEQLEKEVIKAETEESIDYILLRFLKNTPSLVGADLRNYGPFEKEDIAYIPHKNGMILVNDDLAEIISLD
jgi:DNA replication initiation complex subunit (GINS family)